MKKSFVIKVPLHSNYRVYNIMDNIFIDFFIEKSNKKVSEIGNVAIVFFYVFRKDLHGNKDIKKMADDLSMNIEYVKEILEYLKSEKMVIVIPYTPTDEFDQDEAMREIEEEDEIFKEATDFIKNNIYEQ